MMQERQTDRQLELSPGRPSSERLQLSVSLSHTPRSPSPRSEVWGPPALSVATALWAPCGPEHNRTKNPGMEAQGRGRPNGRRAGGSSREGKGSLGSAPQSAWRQYMPPPAPGHWVLPVTRTGSSGGSLTLGAQQAGHEASPSCPTALLPSPAALGPVFLADPSPRAWRPQQRAVPLTRARAQFSFCL